MIRLGCPVEPGVKGETMNTELPLSQRTFTPCAMADATA
jgi:hypothetical protein